jgi:hypothetical protein
MDRELEQRIESLPEDIKAAIKSEETGETIRQIGARHGLHIDQIGLLQEATLGVMAGYIHPDDYVEKLQDAVGIDEDISIEVATDVNAEVLLPLRNSIMQIRGSESAQEPLSTSRTEMEASKEDILAEIENPTPVAHPISSVDQTIPGPAKPREITPGSGNGAMGFIGEKLTQSVSMPAQRVEVPQNPKAQQKPKGYAADPYREPLS